MTLLRPPLIVSAIVVTLPPYSQVLSVRLGAPSAGLPLPSGPWQAAHTVSNFSLPLAALAELCAEPESDSTKLATSSMPSLPPTAAPMGGITPLRPLVIVVRIASCEPPHSQSPSDRLGKPREPCASDPWHWAQLFRKMRWPMACALGLEASLSKGSWAKAAKTGPKRSSAALTSA